MGTLFSQSLSLDSTRASTGVPRRAFLLMPAAFAAVLWAFHEHQPPLADPNETGTGPFVDIAIFGNGGSCGKQHVVRVRKLVLSDASWAKRLASGDYAVARQGQTEWAFTGRYAQTHAPGIYACICCATALFASWNRFESGTGWPSFSKPIAPQNVASQMDNSLNMNRTKVLCSRCDAHLGHVFRDGPMPSGLRYCINSAALHLQPFLQSGSS